MKKTLIIVVIVIVVAAIAFAAWYFAKKKKPASDNSLSDSEKKSTPLFEKNEDGKSVMTPGAKTALADVGKTLANMGKRLTPSMGLSKK